MNAETPPKPVAGKAAQSVGAPASEPPIRARRSKRVVLMLLLPIVLALAGGAYWLNGGRYETTDNANLHRARIAIASNLPGRVVSVGIADYAEVKQGDVLFQVDPAPYRLELAAAEAALDAARLQVEQLKVNYAQAQLRAALAADDAAYQQSELTRMKELAAKGVASTTALDKTRHLARRADEQSAVTEHGVANALAALGGDAKTATDRHPLVQARLVARDQARYDLEQATVTAPIDGVIYKAASFKPGQFVATGQSLFALLVTGDVWVDANFKETQLDGIKIGQSAEVRFDSLPDRVFKARVEAIGAGTGAEFSLLPAQNATGNWVKVTQRIPVRLSLDDKVSAASLASGLSAKVSIDTGRHRSLSWPIVLSTQGSN